MFKPAVAVMAAFLASCSAAEVASIGAGLACGTAMAATAGVAGLACLPVSYGAGFLTSAVTEKPVTTIYVDRAEDVLEIIIRSE